MTQIEIINIDKQGPITDQSTFLPIRDPNVNELNKWLKSHFGHAHQRQIYRIVWSENLFETRISYEDTNGNFLAFPKYEKVDKYSYIQNRWILEKLVHLPIKEVAGSDSGHYEPIHVFQTRTGEYLEPILRAVQLITYALLNGTPWTKQEWEDMDLKRQEREIELFEEVMGQDSTPFLLKLKQGETSMSSKVSEKASK